MEKGSKNGNFELKLEWGTEFSKVAKNNYFHTVLSKTQMVLGQVEVAEDEKIFLGHHFALFKLQSLLKPHSTLPER